MDTDVAPEMRARLHRAIEDQHGVWLTRSIPGADHIDGYVVAMGEEWVLLSRIDDHRPKGFCALRIADVQRIKTLREDALLRQVLEAAGFWPPASPSVELNLDSTRGVVETAHRAATLVNIQVEHELPDEAFIGLPIGWNSASVVMEEITPQGMWDDSVSEWAFDSITRVEFDSDYERDLLLVGGLPPARS